MRTLLATFRQLRTLEKVEKPCRKKWDSDVLRIVAFSDYRVQDISLLVEFLGSLKPAPDLLLYAGDDVERFHSASRNLFQQLAATVTHGLCAVIGNDSAEDQDDEDGPMPVVRRLQLLKEVTKERAYIRGRGVHNVHLRPVVIGNYAVIGSEGSPPDEQWGALGTVTYPETSIARHLRESARAVERKHLIVLSHTPPRGTLDFALRFGKRPIGSVALRQFVLTQRNVPLVVCGHVHNCGEQSKKLGCSIVVNAASHDSWGSPGRLAVIEIRAGKVTSVKWQLLWELMSIADIGAKRESLLKDAGIHTPRELAEASEERIATILKSGQSGAARVRSRALSFCRQDIVLLTKKLRLPTAKRAYLDIETDLSQTFIWLVGLHLEDENRTVAFYAETPQEEKRILSDMLQFIQTMPELNILSYSGTRFEERVLARRLTTHKLSSNFAYSVTDTYFDIHACAAFPVQGLGLKPIAKCCGFKWRGSGLDGWDAALLYGAGRLTKASKRALLTYNEDDLLALKHVVLHLEKLGQRRALAAHGT
jgi:uncharacterized protein YprB with RNaseH-like and TPR domain/calcineurin-like phosphoesterase family protein